MGKRFLRKTEDNDAKMERLHQQTHLLTRQGQTSSEDNFLRLEKEVKDLKVQMVNDSRSFFTSTSHWSEKMDKIEINVSESLKNFAKTQNHSLLLHARDRDRMLTQVVRSVSFQMRVLTGPAVTLFDNMREDLPKLVLHTAEEGINRALENDKYLLVNTLDRFSLLPNQVKESAKEAFHDGKNEILESVRQFNDLLGNDKFEIMKSLEEFKLLPSHLSKVVQASAEKALQEDKNEIMESLRKFTTLLDEAKIFMLVVSCLNLLLFIMCFVMGVVKLD